MDIEKLPSQLHFDIKTELPIEDLLPTATELFTDADNIEIRGDTLYLYDPTDLVKFVHISQKKVGVVFSPDITTGADIHAVWATLDKLLIEFGVVKLKKFNWQIKLVQPFKSKRQRDLVAKKLSPIEGYLASSLTLYPEKNKGHHIHLSMVKKEKTANERGLLVNFVFEEASVQRRDVPEKLESFKSNFNNSVDLDVVVKGLLG